MTELTLRSEKGSALTYEEMDNNFLFLFQYNTANNILYDSSITNIAANNVQTAIDIAHEDIADLQEGLSESTPAGAVLHFARSTPPAGWLKANGAEVSRTTYANLFAAVGTLYGPGDGSTTFNLPDLRGEFIRSLDDGRGVDSGRSLGTNQSDAFQGHGHDVYHGDTFPGTNRLRNNGGGGTGSGNIRQNSDGTTEVWAQDIIEYLNGTPRVANETRPRNVALLACIKY